MRFGLSLPIFDQLADPRLLADLAVAAEQAGWDGIFVWDHLRYRAPAKSATDPWVALAAMATRTERIHLGPMVTPIARRRPQVLARQLVALDQLSGGRVIFGAGLGQDTSGEEFVGFGEATDAKVRAAMLDEGLDVLTGLLSGELIDHHGEHFTAAATQFLPTPVKEHIPFWLAARWPNPRPLRRAARYDGVYVIEVTPADLPALIATIQAERGLSNGTPFDVVVHDTATADPGPWRDAGATWLLTTFDPFTVTADEVRNAVTAGPAPSSSPTKRAR
jgi:alkanesulfonate monooxygenase SsuD/methylene tetrahydromethanopterin reductase-like flavin-dependent oxidoreductase (luciferase family)